MSFEFHCLWDSKGFIVFPFSDLIRKWTRPYRSRHTRFSENCTQIKHPGLPTRQQSVDILDQKSSIFITILSYLLMGTILSSATQKGTSSRVDSDSSISVHRDMAEFRSRDSTIRQQFNEIPPEKKKRYAESLKEALEFLNISQSVMDYQRQLEAELEKCHERYLRIISTMFN